MKQALQRKIKSLFFIMFGWYVLYSNAKNTRLPHCVYIYIFLMRITIFFTSISWFLPVDFCCFFAPSKSYKKKLLLKFSAPSDARFTKYHVTCLGHLTKKDNRSEWYNNILPLPVKRHHNEPLTFAVTMSKSIFTSHVLVAILEHQYWCLVDLHCTVFSGRCESMVHIRFLS